MIDHEVVNDNYTGKRGEKPTITRRMHRVQILDPATGTGTFLAAVIRQIYANMEGQRGGWNSYVEQHLLPRLNGFELMMASYTIAHLKLNMVLRETSYTSQSDQRLRVYLTNSLEEHNAETGTLFATAISNEAAEASHIKRDCPVMVMVGNPPYSVSSSNNSDYITRLLDDYKRDLNERNIQPLSDDYIKFIRLGQEYISKNGEGILAFICNNSFLDGIIHRQMRKELMNTFDKIYILDLHGNSRKKETAPDGSKDENVFDIMQGVSINIFYRSKKSDNKHGCKIFHFDLYGTREKKFEFLQGYNLESVPWKELHPQEPYKFFVPKDFSLQEEYEKGFKLTDIFMENVSGVKTSKDIVNIWDSPQEVKQMVNDLFNMDDEQFRVKYNIGKDSRDWSIARSREDVLEAKDNGTFRISSYTYRPFENKFIVYTGKTNGIVARPRFRSFASMLNPNNFSLIVCRQIISPKWQHVFIAPFVSDMCSISTATKEISYVFPIYIQNPAVGGSIFGENQGDLLPNLNPDIVAKITNFQRSEALPTTIFDYIYAVLHSPNYRTKYKEFLKIDFPRIPYPENKEEYHRLSDLGGQLRRLHLMQEVPTPKHAKFDNPGSNTVDKPEYKDGCVWINKEQCFADVPELAWNFYIGGYQPAQKWLKDRKGRILSYDDITHYRRIISILLETDRLMKKIDQSPTLK